MASPPVLLFYSKLIHKIQVCGGGGLTQLESKFICIVARQRGTFGNLADPISLACPGKREMFFLSVIFIISRAGGADCAWHSR